MTRSEATKLVAVTVAACGQAGRMSAEQVAAMRDAWVLLLGDLEYATANAALTVLLQRSSFLPSVAEIRATVLELERGPVRTGVEAWGDVQRAIAQQGMHRVPGVDFAWRDPVTARVVRALGWVDMCTSENVVSDRARFCDAYDALAKQARHEQQVPALAAARERRGALTAGEATAHVLRLVPGQDNDA